MFHVVNMIKIDQNKSVIDLDTLLCCHSSIPTAFMVYLANRNQPNINIKSNRQIYMCNTYMFVRRDKSDTQPLCCRIFMIEFYCFTFSGR